MNAPRMAVTDEGKAQQVMALVSLREWLRRQGFGTGENHHASQQNLCRWFAWRPTTLVARECELNTGKKVQLVLSPHMYTLRDRQYVDIEINLAGRNTDWFALKAYSLGPGDVHGRLHEIETKLVSAWNALGSAS